jgi:hypothetical protein
MSIKPEERKGHLKPSQVSLPLCSKCGQPLKLVDVVPLGKAVGLKFTNDESRYILQCCGLETVIDDDEEYARAVETLKSIGSFG